MIGAVTAGEAEVRRRCEEQGRAVLHYVRKRDGFGTLRKKVEAALERK